MFPPHALCEMCVCAREREKVDMSGVSLGIFLYLYRGERGKKKFVVS